MYLCSMEKCDGISGYYKNIRYIVNAYVEDV
jgi:hypothetical protein